MAARARGDVSTAPAPHRHPTCFFAIHRRVRRAYISAARSGVLTPAEVPVPDVPYRVDKPWGYELVWARTDRYVGKILHVKAGHVLSLQYHNLKDETMHVLRGELILRTRPGEALEARAFKAGESVHIPPTLVHQIEAVMDSDVLEASTPELDDLVRLQDRYGRG
jgi:quercetin dioxygenase-like cupin family protein